MQVLGMWDKWQEGQQDQCVRPPEHPCGQAGVCHEKRCQIGGHEREDEAGNDAGFPGDFMAWKGWSREPDGTHKKTADE